MPSDHQIITLNPLYGPRSEHVAVCVCGWQSDPEPTPGKATIAGWQHIHTSPQEIVQDEAASA